MNSELSPHQSVIKVKRQEAEIMSYVSLCLELPRVGTVMIGPQVLNELLMK